MKVYEGYFKAYEHIGVPDDMPIEQIRDALATHLSHYYFANVGAEDVEGVEEIEGYDLNDEFLSIYGDEDEDEDE